MNKNWWIPIAIFFITNLVAAAVGVGIFTNKLDTYAEAMSRQIDAIERNQMNIIKNNDKLIELSAIQKYTLERIKKLEESEDR